MRVRAFVLILILFAHSAFESRSTAIETRVWPSFYYYTTVSHIAWWCLSVSQGWVYVMYLLLLMYEWLEEGWMINPVPVLIYSYGKAQMDFNIPSSGPNSISSFLRILFPGRSNIYTLAGIEHGTTAWAAGTLLLRHKGELNYASSSSLKCRFGAPSSWWKFSSLYIRGVAEKQWDWFFIYRV